MKKIIFLLTIVSLAFVSCDGDPGPPGPPGQDGADGGIFEASAFDEVVNFTAANEYSALLSIPEEIEVLSSDTVLVYILWKVDGAEIWRLIPQTVFFDDGMLAYNYDFTQGDVSIFLDGTIDFGTLDSGWTTDQLFRIVVVPTFNIDGVDVSNFDALNNAINIQEYRNIN